MQRPTDIEDFDAVHTCDPIFVSLFDETLRLREEIDGTIIRTARLIARKLWYLQKLAPLHRDGVSSRLAALQMATGAGRKGLEPALPEFVNQLNAWDGKSAACKKRVEQMVVDTPNLLVSTGQFVGDLITTNSAKLGQVVP